MRRTPAPPPTPDDVLECVLRLAERPGRTVPAGRGSVTLTGPSVTDISRALGSYEVHITPALAQHVAAGLLVCERVGPFKVYRPAPAPAEARAG